MGGRIHPGPTVTISVSTLNGGFPPWPRPDDYDQREDPGWFRDELRQRDRLIADLRQEQDEAADLIRRLREHAEDFDRELVGTLGRLTLGPFTVGECPPSTSAMVDRPGPRFYI